MNHNPRKFEEKIALNKQKQAEQDKQFEDIIRDVSNIRDNEVRIWSCHALWSIETFLPLSEAFPEDSILNVNFRVDNDRGTILLVTANTLITYLSGRVKLASM